MTSVQRGELPDLSREHHDYLDLIVAAAKAGYARGRESVLGSSYPQGHALGFDHGYGARQDARPLVRGLIDGYDAGLAERHRMLEEIRDRDRIRHLASHPVEKAAAS